MPPAFILRRMWRERRLLGVLLVALCLVTGFFALGPLFVRAASEAGLRYAVENSAPERLAITISNANPLGQDTWDVLNRTLGSAVTDLTRSARSAGTVNGYAYTLGEPTTLFTAPTPNDYQIVAYSNLRDVVQLMEGRWPERLAPPAEVSAVGLSDEQQAARQVGDYSRGEVEAVISTVAAAEARMEVGNRVVVGAEPGGATTVVRIVGLVEPRLALDDPFWEGQRLVILGRWVPISLFEERYDFGLIVPEGAFEDWIAPVTRGNTYVWTLHTDPDAVHADTLDALESRLTAAQNSLRARYPDILILSGLFDLLAAFRADLLATEGPITLLSGAVLVLMLYHLVTTVALVLEQQNVEWAAISSRGGSIPQLIGMQAATMSVLGAIGAAAGPFVAQAILALLGTVGPLAHTLSGAGSIPARAFALSGAAALAAVAILTLPAWPAARRSLLQLKQLVSRPPTQPGWARYLLDFVFLALGLGLLLRLYFMISGDAGGSLGVLLRDPATLVRRIAAGAADAGGLNDPFNLLGPALVLTGAALLWLRVFPLGMRLLGRIAGAGPGLTGPLALWHVERDPGHYAQLVLLLIGTLALGTASLALDATRDAGAWAVARHEVGAAARVTFDPRDADAQTDWAALPDVTAAETLLVTATPQRAGQKGTTLFGLEAESFAATFPEQAEAVAALGGQAAWSAAGLALPEDTTLLTLQVFAEGAADGLPTETRLMARLSDALGVPVALPLNAADPTLTGVFTAYEAALPVLGTPPWRLTGLQFQTQRGDLQDFTQRVYLDEIAVVTAAGERVLVEGFEGEVAAWGPQPDHLQFPGDLSSAVSAEPVAAGNASLAVEVRIRRMGGRALEPVLAVNAQAGQAVPLVVSSGFATYQGERAARRTAYQVGDEDTLDLELPFGRVQFRFRVVGIVDEFPTAAAGDNFVIGALPQVQAALNTGATPTGYYAANQVWLELAGREPSVAFGEAVGGLPGVTEVLTAWERYNAIQRAPLPNAITGMLFAGFWVSLALSVLDFAFYLAVTARRRALSFAVLRAIGWDARHLWGVLAAEQAALVIPAMLVGVGLGAALAYLLLPFLELVGSQALRFPVGGVGLLLVVLVVVFAGLLGVTALFVRRQSVNQALRLGEE